MDKKLSFSIASKPASSKPNRNPLKTSRTFTDNDGHGNKNNSSHRFITEFNANDKALDLNQDSSGNNKRIIAPIENEYMPGKRMKNLDLPLRSAARSGGDVDFEADPSANNEGADTNILYGLNIRESGKNGEGSEDRQSKKSVDHVLLKKLKEDISRLPEDEESFDQFDEVPVEGFGEALMAGYGWKDGMGIGKNAKEDAKVVEYKKWAGRGGLGAFADLDENVKKDAGSDSRDRVDGGVQKLEKLRLDDPRANKREKVPVSNGRDNGRKESKRTAEERRRDDVGHVKRDTVKREEKRESKRSWLRSQIKVRIISQKFRGGKFYLKKGKVLDVVGPTTCDICMDDTKEMIQGVDQDILETALPRTGGHVLVLSGKHKGVYGSLVKKDADSEKGMVQDADTQALLNVRLEQIAEYVGDPSDIGY